MMNETPAGEGPAEEMDVVEEVAVPSVAMLKAELAHAQSMVAILGEWCRERPQSVEHLSNQTAKLMAASALAASAIAKIVDAETRQRLATERIRSGYFPPRYRPEPRRAHDGDDRR
jgi:hypothetical protein